MKNFPAIFFLFFILFQSCSEDEEDRNGICTDEYRTIVVSITDSQGVPVALDDFKVVVLKNGRDITIELTDATFQFMRERGTYPIFSDKYHEEYRQQELDITFTGFIDNREVVNSNYRVGADHCHVYHISGDLELIIDLE